MLCMSSVEIPVNVFMDDPPTSRSAIAKGTIHLTHSSTSTLFKAVWTERWAKVKVTVVKMEPQTLACVNLTVTQKQFISLFSYLKHFPPAPKRRSETGLKQQERHWKTPGIAHLACTGPTTTGEKQNIQIPTISEAILHQRELLHQILYESHQT